METIGDAYMAVTGLPEPDSDHAINMARFAYQCVLRFATVTEELEALLGPGTSALSIRYESIFYCLCRNLGLAELTCSYLTRTLRVGMHSGPVTGGVLRGQKSRFQVRICMLW